MTDDPAVPGRLKFGTRIMGVSLRHLGEVARTFEDNGFESVWVPEHLVFPVEMPAAYPYSSDGLPPVTPETPAYDPWALLSHIAASTQRIRLATNIYILPLRHPLQTARTVVTVDRLSGGRVTLGVGVGWLPDEFDYLGVPFASRGRRADATIEVLRRLWSEEVIEVANQHFSFGPVRFNPKPVRPEGIPIEVGGSAPAALRRAGRLGDGWIEIGSVDVEDFRAKMSVVNAARRAAGRDGRPFEVTVQDRSGSRDAYLRWRDAGATRILVGPPADPSGRISPQVCREWAQRFSDEVITRLD